MSQSQPERPGLAGTKLVHYGQIWDGGLESARESHRSPVALLVCHGMGQQVRYETISSVAEAILTEARAEGAKTLPVEVHLSEANDDFLARAEVKWVKDDCEHEVHVYEAYWAPLTEGKVTYWDTVKFLVRASWGGLKYSRPFSPASFQRWVFGGPKKMPVSRIAWFGLLLTLACLLLQVGIIAYVSLVLAQQWKLAVTQPLPAGGIAAWLEWLGILVPGIQPGSDWFSNLTHLLFWLVLAAEALFVRYFIIEFVGDVAAYVSPYKESKFDELRRQIRKIGLNVGKVIYGFGPRLATVPQYDKVVVVGHSLGSVLAYDTLNALINLDNVCSSGQRRSVIERTRALITFGSPLDKTAFIFRLQAKYEQDWIREQLAASSQPLIVSYEDYRPLTFKWVNLWSPMDIISGSLEYYDDPAGAPTPEQRVENIVDRQARVPFAAHVQYWRGEELRKQLYKYVGETPTDPQVMGAAM
jgi:hypothetical protein